MLTCENAEYLIFQEYELFHYTPKVFSFWKGSYYLFVLNERISHILKHCFPMTCRPVKTAPRLPWRISVTPTYIL